MVDDFTELLGRQDGAEARLAQARDDQPLAWALVMAALSWDQVDRRGWRAPAVLGAQARRLMAAWGVPTESVDDADRVGAALEWATRDPALVECDGQGHYRPVYGVGFPVGSRLWREHHHAAVVSGVLTPLELVGKGDADRDAREADLDAAEVSYRLAVDGDDPDAAVLASLRLAELAELREQPAEAACRYAETAASDVVEPLATDEAPYGAGSHAPLDDAAEAPEGHEIKGNANSMLYHVPGSSHYDRTVAEVWFASPEAAEAAGFSLPASQRTDDDEDES